MSAETQAKASASEGVTSSERSQLEGGPASKAGGGSGAALAAITQRELASLFYSPIAYVVGFIFLLLTGYSFVTETLVAGNEASMRTLFEHMASVLVFALPLLTMRLVADEFATDTIETLMTAPVTDASVILGKFFGALLFYVALLATTIPHLIMMAIQADPIGSVVFGGYLGLILLGALFIAIGLFASCCTRHQLLAALIAISVLAAFTFVADYGAEYAGQLWQRNVCSYLNVLGHFSDFSKGIIDTRSLIFFLSGAGLFLFLATKVLESRRWR